MSGNLDALEEIAGALAAQGRFHRRLPVTVPYHGPQMEDLRDEFGAALEGLDPRPPAVRMVSTVTGTYEDGLLDAGYWWRNLREPVLFSTAMDRLVADGLDAFVELSPHPVLAPSVIECLEANGRDAAVLPSLRRGEEERAVMLRALGALHVRGRPVQWPAVFGEGRRHVRLPTYPWQRERHWFEPRESGPLRPPGRDTGHPLLGRRLRGARPTWEADLGDPRVAYLSGHLVQGRPTLPGAAYVEMGLAAARALRGPGPSVLEQVEFHRLAGLPDRDDVALQCLVDGRESAIEIHSGSRNEPPGWVLRAGARLGTAPSGSGERVDVGALRERCPAAVEPDSFYSWLEDHLGLRYEGAFRGLRELRRGDGEALGEIALPLADAAGGEMYSVHPALLDAAFHVLGAAAVAALDDGDAGTLLPVSIARVEFRGSPGDRFLSHARITRSEGSVVEGDVDLLDDDGNVRLRCEGVRLKLLEQASRGSIGDWLYEDRWEPAPRRTSQLPALEIAAAAQAGFDRSAAACAFGDYYAEVEPALDALATGLVRDALRELGFDPVRDADADADAGSVARRLGVIPRHERFFARLLAISAAAGSTGSGSRAVPEAGDGPYANAFELVGASGRRLARTLRGEEDAREWLVAGEWLPALVELYGECPVFRVYGEAVAEAVAAVVDASGSRTLRVLEVGAGTGGTTGLVLDRLRPGAVEYAFSDVSAFFLRGARERFADRSELRTLILDIEDPTAGIETFDVVVASDVVHATADVRATLGRLRRLLAPGGTLLLLEGTRRSAWTDLVFGQFEGWWRFSDADLRRESALLSVPEWMEVLGETGFTSTAFVTDEPPAGGDPAQAVLVANAPTGETAGAVPRHWLVLTDRQGVGPEVAAALRERGDRCTLVWPGGGYRRFGADGLELSPSATTDWERLLLEVDEVDALIHLWSLDGPVEGDAAQLLGFQETTCGGVTALLQALKSANRALPDLWLVTAGAQSTGGDDHDVRPAQAPLWGLGRVLRNEQGGRRCRMVDLGGACTERDIGALLSELETMADGDGELAFRDGRRLARRQGRMTADPLVHAEGRSMVSPQEASFRLACRVPGSLDTLHLLETEGADPAPDEVAIRVMAAGLNLRDVLIALGMAFAAGREDVDEELLGWECAGIVEACGSAVSHVRPGDAVVAIAGGALGSRVIARAGQVARKPPSLEFEEAATLPVAFVTAEYALTELGRVAPGDRVLIHSASGGVGLAALQVARRAGAEVLATAGSPEKRAYLESLGVRHVMDSRSLAFADEVLRRTGGDGVDVVLNSLPGEAIAKGLSVLRPHGRFIELGKRDIYEGRELRLSPFRNNRSFHGLDLYALFRDRPEAVDPILRSIMDDVEAGSLSPLPHQDFDVDEAETAFRLMAQARHIGKVVLTVRRPGYAVVPRERAPLFREDATYLLAGGLGGFGIAVAAWMVRAGARHLVLTSRTGRPHDEDAPSPRGAARVPGDGRGARVRCRGPDRDGPSPRSHPRDDAAAEGSPARRDGAGRRPAREARLPARRTGARPEGRGRLEPPRADPEGRPGPLRPVLVHLGLRRAAGPGQLRGRERLPRRARRSPACTRAPGAHRGLGGHRGRRVHEQAWRHPAAPPAAGPGHPHAGRGVRRSRRARSRRGLSRVRRTGGPGGVGGAGGGAGGGDARRAGIAGAALRRCRTSLGPRGGRAFGGANPDARAIPGREDGPCYGDVPGPGRQRPAHAGDGSRLAHGGGGEDRDSRRPRCGRPDRRSPGRPEPPRPCRHHPRRVGAAMNGSEHQGSDESRARTLDRLAEQVLANLVPMLFEVARSREDVDAVLRMRYECVVAQGWVRPSDYPDGRERDEDDEGATFVVCRDDDKIIGCMRLVPPRPDRPLPTEREYGIRVRPAGKVAEAGRIIVSPRTRSGRSHLVIGGLCARGWLLAREQGHERAVSTATPELIELYRGLGLSITVLGPPQMHWGEERAPIQIDGAQNSFGFLLTGSPNR